MTIALQRCTACGTHQYPSRDICRTCLSDAIAVVEDPGTGRLLASSVVHRSLDENVALPLRIGTVMLDAGPHLICFVADDVAVGGRVLLDPMTDASGRSLWTARSLSDGDAASR
jgi:uncharacterized OB-fold protein